MEAQVVPEVPHVAGRGLDPAREDELAVRVPATDAVLAFGSLASKTKLTKSDMKLAQTINTGMVEKVGPRLRYPTS